MIAAIILLGAGCTFTVTRYLSLNSYTSQLEQEISSNQKTVYVATDNIAAGDQLVDGKNVTEQTIFTGLDSAIYMSDDMLGSKALVPISQGMAVEANMIGSQDIASDTRDAEISVVSLMTDQKVNDVVDVRILFPDGTDYIVLPKKMITSLSLKNNIFHTNLSEEEMVRLTSATIDAYLTQGAKLYTVRYVQPTVQNEAIPYYPVRSNVIDLLHNDPNVLDIAQQTLNANARNDLDDRVGSMSDENLNNITTGQAAADKSVETELQDQEESGAETDSTETAPETDSETVSTAQSDRMSDIENESSTETAETETAQTEEMTFSPEEVIHG